MIFNPEAAVQILPIAANLDCLVVDDALLQPEAWVEQAAKHREFFAIAPSNAYPGVEFEVPESLGDYLAAFFKAKLRNALGARRLLEYYCRLAMVTQAPAALQPAQWLCHRDRAALGPGEVLMASVLYLFDEPALGGTDFYVPAAPAADVAALIQDSGRLTAAAFTAKYGLAPGYPAGDNRWFRKVASVPAKWNRLICYAGSELFHAGHIAVPERLTDDPRTGRLTMNGFFRCRRVQC
ncbi:MAG: DUF6445 family protein [Pseudomonadota bacterium]